MMVSSPKKAHHKKSLKNQPTKDYKASYTDSEANQRQPVNIHLFICFYLMYPLAIILPGIFDLSSAHLRFDDHSREISQPSDQHSRFDDHSRRIYHSNDQHSRFDDHSRRIPHSSERHL